MPRPAGNKGKARAIAPVTRPVTPSVLVAAPALPDAARVAVLGFPTEMREVH